MEKIYGVGVDEVACDRVKKACEKKSFLDKYYTEAEQELISKRYGRVATNFAGKEAVVKALRTGFSGITPKEVEILREENGAPYVRLNGHAKELAEKLQIKEFHISLADTKEFATAYAVAVQEIDTENS